MERGGYMWQNKRIKSSSFLSSRKKCKDTDTEIVCMWGIYCYTLWLRDDSLWVLCFCEYSEPGLPIFVLDCLFKDVCTVNSFGRQRADLFAAQNNKGKVFLQGRGWTGLLVASLKVWCFLSLEFHLARMQTHCKHSVHWSHSAWPHATWEWGKGNWTNMKLKLFAVPQITKSSFSEPGSQVFGQHLWNRGNLD